MLIRPFIGDAIFIILSYVTLNVIFKSYPLTETKLWDILQKLPYLRLSVSRPRGLINSFRDLSSQI